MNLDLIDIAIKEDLPNGDITSQSIIEDSHNSNAYLVSKANYIVSGIDIAEKVFHRIDKNIFFKALKKNSEEVLIGEKVFEVSGKTISILKAERLALNFLGIMFAIATKTNYFVKLVKHTKVILLDTRKTIPGMRALSKEAVLHGGGTNHRANLSDKVLIKENHIYAAGGIENALKNFDPTNIEIEVKDIDELKLVLSLGVKRILLDNFSVEMVKTAVLLNNQRAELEVSGGVNEANLLSYASTGVNYISIGALTHSINFADISFIINYV